MSNNKDNKNTTITFRTSEELKKELKTMAEKDRRSLSEFIEMILEKAVKDKK